MRSVICEIEKVLLALGFSLALSASVFAADNMWQYNQYTSIDMNSAKLYYDMGRQVLSFNTVENPVIRRITVPMYTTSTIRRFS